MGLTQKLGTIPLAIQTDSSNNVGIGGAANASYKLAVTGASLFTGAATFSSSVTSSGTITAKDTTNDASVLMTGLDGAYGLIQANNAAGSLTKNLVLQKYGGNVGIGTSSPSGILQVQNVQDGVSGKNLTLAYNGTYYAEYTEKSIRAYNNELIIGTGTGGAERMRITSGGDVLVGTTDNAARLVVRGISDSGSNFALWVTNSLGSLGLGVRNDTLIQAPGIHSYSYASTANVFVQSDGFLGRNTSSLKYKKNVEDYTRGLADVLKLRPVLYESKNPSEANKKFTGFIAEEIDALGLTEFVQYAEDGSPDALQYPHFVALLAAAIQELNAKVTALENK